MSSPAAPTPEAEIVRADSADKVPLGVKLAYGFGGMGDMFGHLLYPSLARPLFNMQLGLSPTLVGLVLMLSRLGEGISDTVFGWLSDNTRSRWGRRRPYILVGSIAAGITLPGLFLASGHWNAAAPWASNRLFWFMLVSSVLFAPIVSMFTMPFASLGSELTPSYHERTNVIAFKAVMQKIAGLYIAASWWMARSFGMDPLTRTPDVLAGARVVAALGGGILIAAGITSFLLIKERYYEKARVQPNVKFWRNCRDTFSSRSFVTLLAIVVIFAGATAIGNDLAQYAGTYYVFHGDLKAMSEYSFYSGVLQFAFGVAGIFLAKWNARRFGKRKALFFSLALGALVYAATWWTLSPARPWMLLLNTAFTVVATTGVWVLAPSMCVDVVDDAELKLGQRREGAVNSWLSWSVKVCLAVSWFGSGLILDATGFNASLGGGQMGSTLWQIRFLLITIPAVALVVAMLLVCLYPLSQRRVLALRLELEAKRGAV